MESLNNNILPDVYECLGTKQLCIICRCMDDAIALEFFLPSGERAVLRFSLGQKDLYTSTTTA